MNTSDLLMEYDLQIKKQLLNYGIEHSVHGKICEDLSIIRNNFIQQLTIPKVLVEIDEGVVNYVTSNMSNIEVSICDTDDNYDKDSNWFVYHKADPDIIVTDEEFDKEIARLEEEERKEKGVTEDLYKDENFDDRSDFDKMPDAPYEDS